VAVTGPGTEADIAPVVAGIVVADMAAAIAAEAAVATADREAKIGRGGQPS
jgi:hypothetical protein